MADNLTLPAAAMIIATDDISGVHYQRIKLAYGVDGAATDLVEKPAVDSSIQALQASVDYIGSGYRNTDNDYVTADVGQIILGLRHDSDTVTAAADNKYAPLHTDGEGRLKVATKPADFTLLTGNITANAQTVSADVRRASNVQVHMVAASLSGHNSTFEGSIDSTNGTDGNWFAIQVVRSNANTIELTTGVLAATPAYAWEGSVNGLSFIRVRATAHTSGTATWKFQRGSHATEPIPAAQISGTQPVSFTQPAQVAGTALMGDVGLQVRANATGAATIAKVIAAATTNATSVKASAGRVFGWSLTNTTAAIKVLRFYNLTVAPTVGTSVPAFVVYLPASAHVNYSLPVGISFATGIAYAITGAIADLDATAVVANDVLGSIYYA